jgi:hypothetical protein
MCGDSCIWESQSIKILEKTKKLEDKFPVNYHETLADPAATATRVAQFLDLPLAVDAMASAVDPRLHRQRV